MSEEQSPMGPMTNPASLTVPENAGATVIDIAAPSDPNYAAGQLSVTVIALPSDGTIYLANSFTTVSAGESLTVAQLTELTFVPTPGVFSTSSSFDYTVSDPTELTANGSATLTIGADPPLTIIAPSDITIGTGEPNGISGVDISETGSGTLTVTVADSEGLLSASGSGVSGAGTAALTITGSLAQVNSDLATLSVDEAAGGFDTITITASDNLGDTAPPQTIAVTSIGPIAFYTFDNTTGAVAPDLEGLHDGVIVGATPNSGGGLAFNGTSDFVSVPDSSDFNFGSGDFSIDLWANFATAPGGSEGHPGDVLISQDEGGGNENKWFISAFSGYLDFHVNSPTLGPQFFALTPFNPTPGQWYNITLTRTGSQFQFYIDGELAGSATESFALPNVDAPITIGVSGEAFGGYFDGDLSQVGIYNDAISFSVVQQIYQDGVTGAGSLPITPASFQLSTTEAGDTGTFTLTIGCTDPVFGPGATVTLSQPGAPDIVSTSTTIDPSNTGLTATFDLNHAADGSYTATINNPDGSTYTVGTQLQVAPVNASDLWAEIIGPTGVRVGFPETFAIEYGNSGNVDATDADISVLTDPSVNLTVHPSSGATFQYSGDEPTTTGLEDLDVSQISGLDVPAGSVNVIPFTVETNVQGPPVQLGGTITSPLTLSDLEGEVGIAIEPTIDWSSFEASLRPPSIDSTDWALIWNRFMTEVGSTTQGLIEALSSVATTLSIVGEPTTDVSSLLLDELEEAAGILPNIALANTTDIAENGGGLSLSLTRTYNASFLDRNNPGPFGDGWTFTYGVTASADASGNVYITSPSGVEIFTAQPGGGYAAQPGDASSLTTSDGAFVLTAADGTVERFLTDGQLGNITDTNGNTITINYDSSDFISSVTSSDGESLTFTTNAQGRITSATDNNGQTTTYTYNSSGNLLVSASGAGGVTTYSYDTSGNPYTQDALTQIANPDGSVERFGYNTQGSLTSEAGLGDSGQYTFSYPGVGTFTATDAAGNTTKLAYNMNGNLAETTDALGNVTQYQYNPAGELSGVVTPTGGDYNFTYDADGNLTSYTDPDDGTVTATYKPGTDLLTSLTDQNGNTTNYTYNSAGDLTSITYNDGSGTTYQYSSSGLLTSETDARGQTTTYSYDAQGLLTQESFGDGTYQAYTYNAESELTSAQAASGRITTYGYNSAGELTSVTNPAGQVESYTYNSAGQELTRTEPDGSITQYSYNAAGQLAEIADGSGNLITQYTYNALGELTGSLDGNGQTTSYNYDPDGNVTQILTKDASGNITSQLDYTYNANGEAATATSLDGTWTYTYDAMGQLTNAVFASTNPSIPDQNLTYEYDAAGNRTQTIFNGTVNNYTTNGLNQYTASDGTTYDYDADGNLVTMTQNGQTTTYTYNSQNQLIAESGPSGNFTYTYDALGNMVSSTDNGVVSNYIIDPLAIDTSATGPLSAIAQAYNTAGAVTATYDYGNSLAAEITGSGIYYYNADLTGDVTSLSGPGGNVVDSYNYTPFGTLLESNTTIPNPFQYVGEWGISTGADGLIDLGARDYDPQTGRFTTEDPIGIEGGENLYRYAGNSPDIFIDPSGFSRVMSSGNIVKTTYKVVSGAYDKYQLIKNPIGTLIENLLEKEASKIGKVGPLFLQIYELFETETAPASVDEVPVVSPIAPPDDPIYQPPTIPLPTVSPVVLPTVTSSDPNDISGPQGTGTAQYLNGTSPLSYQIAFENSPTATAAAQTVEVTDQLDPTKVNLATFSLGPITFGNELLAPSSGSASYNVVVPYQNPDGSPLDVEVNAGLNAATGLVTWGFTSIDPSTGQPPTNPFAGFLPPDIDPPEGDGSVYFSVQPNSGLATGTQIIDSANITFDANAPIATSQWLNTIDASAPTSSVAGLPASEATSPFLVSWSGTDQGSGIATFTIYDSNDGGPWTPWLVNTTAQSGYFHGIPGHSYGFYSVATDAVGNVQATPSAAEANTTVSPSATVDPGPTAGNGSVIVGSGKTADLTALIAGLITPGILGDTETLSSVSAVLGTAVLNTNNTVTYTAPVVGSDTISYTVADQYDDTASGQVAVTVDPGPSAANGAITLEHGQTVTLTSLLDGLITPGLSGDVETFTGADAAQGEAVLGANNLVSYTAPSVGPDTISYTVADQYGDTANGQVVVTVIGAAAAAFQEISGGGTLSQAGNAYTLDLGTIKDGAAAPTAVFDVLNAASGPADQLSGTISLSGNTADFLTSGLGSIGPLAAGAASGQIDVTLKTGVSGSFSETLSLAATTLEASGNSVALGTDTLSIEGTVAPPSGQVFNLTTGPDTFIEPAGSNNNVVIATSNTLSAGDDMDPGDGGGNTLALEGAGVFNLTLPATLVDINMVTAQEGQASYVHNGVTYVSQTQMVDLRSGLDAIVNVAPATANPNNPNSPTITIVGAANDDSVINLASGNDAVTLGSAQETVNGGGGNNTFYVTGATIGATLNGGNGTNILEVTGGGAMAMGANIKQVADVLLIGATTAYDFTASSIAGLLIDDAGTSATDTLIAGGSNQTVTGGGAGKLTMDAANQSGAILKDSATVFNGDTLKDLVNGDAIDVTGLAYSSTNTMLGFAFNGSSDTTTMSVLLNGVQKTAITLLGQYMASDFSEGADSAKTGTLITLVHELNLAMPH